MITDCKNCGCGFTAKTYRKLFCTDKCKVRYNRENRLTCYFCGDLASSKDHVTPHSTMRLKRRVWSNLDYVMACKECNTLMGDAHPYVLHDRIQHLIDKFTSRHKLNKARIQWDEDELEDMSRDMKRYIAASIAEWNRKQARLDHMRLRRIMVYNAEEESVDVDKIPVDTTRE